jgi:hypothetical protein
VRRSEQYDQGFRVQQRQRTNTALSIIIEQGIVRDQLHGSVLAWKFLASHGVPDHMIARVLAHPSERRNTDTPGHRGNGRPPAVNDPSALPD